MKQKIRQRMKKNVNTKKGNCEMEMMKPVLKPD